jgi:hypothetical protein
MSYPLHELTWQEFEEVVTSICEEILGTGTIIFSDGKDGGRDAKFTGTANNFPSNINSWSGKFIIQAKHTNKVEASCSDSEFKTTLNKEVSSIKYLSKDKKLDHYLIFTNRKLGGMQDPKIEDFIDENLNINNQVLGIERINKWLKDYPLIAKRHNLSRFLLPLQFYEEDLKEIVLTFCEIDFECEKIKLIERKNDRILVEKKNELNSMSQAYFNDSFQRSMKEFSYIEDFFKDPKNRKLNKKYNNTIDDIQSKILVKRDEFKTFEEILEFLYDYIFSLHIDTLKDDRRLIRVFLHYMYFHCDIGVTK